MRASRTSALVALLLFGLAAAAPADSWEFLGERAVTDRVDHDVIAVTAARGDFHSLKLAVRGRAVDFHRVVVHFGNGTSKEIELRQTIPAGGETRLIDLPGNDRVIQKVTFWYDARSLGGQARVRLFGRR
ncbi:MAG TPA: hypothetical protein VIA29_10530 [Thermoanaerobaculia bacterium]